jgi:D-methionine transport system permease protein
MAGSIGGGGLGAIALQRGYARNQTIVMYVAVILLVLLVQILQTIGTKLATKTDKRITK